MPLITPPELLREVRDLQQRVSYLEQLLAERDGYEFPAKSKSSFEPRTEDQVNVTAAKCEKKANDPIGNDAPATDFDTESEQLMPQTDSLESRISAGYLKKVLSERDDFEIPAKSKSSFDSRTEDQDSLTAAKCEKRANDRIRNDARVTGFDTESQMPRTDSLESRIGIYWLSRLGIGFLVLGFALLISYSFQYFGAPAKVGIGMALSAGLVFLSEWLERKSYPLPFARALAGGGWSLAFFTAFAMHHIASVRLIENPIAGFAVLSGVAAGAVWHALAKRSELMAMLAVVLGFITICTSSVGLYSAAASSTLAVITAYLAVAMRWHGLNLLGSIASYACFAGMHERISMQAPLSSTSASLPLQQLVLTSAFLFPYWLTNLWTSLKLKAETRAGQTATLVSVLINSSAFLLFWIPSLHASFGSKGALAYLPLAALYFLAAWLVKKEQPLHPLRSLYCLAGLTLGTMYIPAAMNADWSNLAIALETAVLVGFGLRYNIPSFRWFALALPFFSTLPVIIHLSQLSRPVQLAPVLCALSLACAWIISIHQYRNHAEQTGEHRREAEIALYVFLSSAALIALYAPSPWLFGGFSESTALSAWCGWSSVLTATGIAIGLRLKRLYPAILATIGSCITAAGSIWLGPAAPQAVAIAAGYLPTLKCARALKDGPNWTTPIFYTNLAAWSLATNQFIIERAPEIVCSPLLCLHALVVSLAGFISNRSGLRALGIVLFGAAAISSSSHGWASVLSNAAMLYSIGFLYRRAERIGEVERRWRHVFNTAATWMIAQYAAATLNSGWTSAIWAALGALLLGCGFRLKDQSVRVIGLVLFALLVGKLLVIDLASANGLHRIIAFIAAGVALLSSSFVYNHFKRRTA